MDEKHPLEPLETHRFRMNEFSSQKLKSFRDEVESTKMSHPEVIGATIYGSNVTGQAKETSDIDAYVFVDSDIAGLSQNEDLDSSLERDKEDVVLKKMQSTVLPSLRENATQTMGLTEEDTKDIRVVAVSKNRLDNDINRLIADHKQRNKRKSDFQDYLEGKGPAPEYKHSELPKEGLRYLFHMQLGSGLDPYRAYVLDRFKEEGEVGDQIITELMGNAGFMEGRIPREVNRNIEDLYPQSVNEARKVFGLEYTIPKYPLNENVSS